MQTRINIARSSFNQKHLLFFVNRSEDSWVSVCAMRGAGKTTLDNAPSGSALIRFVLPLSVWGRRWECLDAAFASGGLRDLIRRYHHRLRCRGGRKFASSFLHCSIKPEIF